jgi:hypothetical protein
VYWEDKAAIFGGFNKEEKAKTSTPNIMQLLHCKPLKFDAPKGPHADLRTELSGGGKVACPSTACSVHG